MSISAVMIVRDEEEYLPRCFASLKGLADEIIIVDTGSKDKTREIAQAAGAKVFDHPWENDFSKARNHAFAHATGDWCIIVDADEVIDPKQHETIKKSLAEANGFDSFFIRVRNQMQNGNYSDMPSMRIVRNRIGAHYVGCVHNQLTAYGRYSVIKAGLEHYGYDGISPDRRQKKLERTKTLLEKALAEDPKNPFHIFNMARHYSFAQDWENATFWSLKSISRICSDSTIRLPQTNYPSIFFTLFLACFNRRDYFTPEGHLKYILEIYPDFIDGHFALGTCYAFRHDVKLAEEHLINRYMWLVPFYKRYEIWSHSEIWTPSMEGFAHFYLGMMFKRMERAHSDFWFSRAKTSPNTHVQKMLADSGVLGASNATIQKQ